ncbi:hypothetical protein [Aerosakkonema funiforme]|uniref:hypothetical protein n=1 Tax=Aerosakkonema funiforme TaxID=1246630 RepID=UPI0035B8FA21
MKYKLTGSWKHFLLSSVAAIGTLTILGSIGIKSISVVQPAVAQTMASLARHFRQTGVKMYGASWCPFTQRQKAILGEALRNIQYIECYPAGRGGALNSQCLGRGIQGYPTWEIAGRRYRGLLSLQQVAELSGYGRVANTNNAAQICDDRADEIFYRRHPEMVGQRIDKNQVGLAREWLAIRRSLRGCR